jgi:MFS family permease
VTRNPPVPNIAVRFLRWLLRLDSPVPERNEAELAEEVARNYSWNFAVNLSDAALFWLGSSLVSATTVLPLFVSKLTPNPLAIGMISVISQGAWFLPQLFVANFTERVPRRKAMVVNPGLFVERLPLALLVLAAVAPPRSSALALALFFAGYTIHGLGAGAVGAAWTDLIARCFPVERRGRFFGITMFIAAIMGVGGAGLSAWLLLELPYPTNFLTIFSIAAGCIMLSWIAISLTREPVPSVRPPRVSNREYLRGIPEILRGDHNFRRFVLSRALMAASGMGSGFLTVSALSRWQVADSTVGIYTAVLLIGQTGGSLAFGVLADRFGHKLALQLGAIAGVLGYALAWLAPGPGWAFAAFLMVGVVSSSVLVSGILIVMEFSAPERRPTYIGLANTATGIAGALAPLVGAALASASYEWLFAVCTALYALTAVIYRWWVREPRHAG